MHRAPERGVAIGATAIQVFTKTPSQWREPVLETAIISAFRSNYEKSGLAGVVAHDSYLINLASPDPVLSARSISAFASELTRCNALEIPAVVSHPGNYIDGRDEGLGRNAEALTHCLRKVPGPVKVFLETTAGSGTALGRSFEELAELRERTGEDVRERIAFCADTCHLYSAGYDLVHDWDGVWEQWDRIIGLHLLRSVHVNDSKTPFGSRRDRHELVGEGSLGPEPFRRLMSDSRLEHTIRILETPKGDDPVTNDRKMLRRLRAYRRNRATR